MRFFPVLWLGVALLGLSPAAVWGSELVVDLELVLAVDVSNSMDAGEHVLQRAGYVAAIRRPDIWGAIQGGGGRGIALTYVEWAGPDKQRTVLPWRLIDGPAAAAAFAEDLAESGIFFTRGTGTSISAALAYSAASFAENGFDGRRQVIDISGDGPNNRGIPVDAMRDAVLAGGITINGLPLMLRPSRTLGAVDSYYRDCVIGGPGAFLMPVFAQDQLALAIRRKLVLEIAGHAPQPRVVLAQASATSDC